MKLLKLKPTVIFPLMRLSEFLTSKVVKNGYSFSAEKAVKIKDDVNVIWKAVPIGLALLSLFFLLQKSGI